MFPQRLPDGATFEDNFDGTKTLVWQPLQADIGVTAFTAVAIDPADARLRTAQTVLIAVDAPADPALDPERRAPPSARFRPTSSGPATPW